MQGPEQGESSCPAIGVLDSFMLERTADPRGNSEQPALVTYVTAGYPKAEDTPAIMLAMEKGGAGKWRNPGFPCSLAQSTPQSKIPTTNHNVLQMSLS